MGAKQSTPAVPAQQDPDETVENTSSAAATEQQQQLQQQRPLPTFMLLAKFDWQRDYPELGQGEINLVGNRPGTVLLETESMTFLRYLVPMSMLATPLVTWNRRRRFVTEVGKASVLTRDVFRQCVVFGTATSIVTSFAYCLGMDVLRKQFKNMDEVLDEALFRTLDADYHRWSRTTGACQFIGSVWSVFAGSSSLLSRAAFGWGLGTVFSIPISASKLDLSLDYIFQSSKR